MPKTLPIAILLFCSLFFKYQLSAQTLAGGEVYYELIGAKKYKVTAHLYRMCESAALNGITANVYGDTVVRAMHFKRIAIAKINDTCNNPCNKQNTASNPGFEKHTYIDTIDFNVAPYDVFVSKQICVVNFGVRMAARYANPTTLDTGQFYIDAATNICLSHITKNTSPQFSMEPKFKQGCNYPLIYSPGPLDSTDNDSFVFSLANVQSNYKVNMTYKGSLTSQIPMSPFCLPPGTVNCKPLRSAKPPRGFYFENQNCVTVFTPNSCNEVGTIKYKIDEYRFNKQTQKHEWLGYTTREMLLQIVKMPNNNLPQGPTSYSNWLICEGEKLCTKFISRDISYPGQVIPDTTQLFWDYGIKDAIFKIKDSTAREKEAEFCWQTIKKPNQRLENYFLTVGTYDRKCNLNFVSYTQTIATSPAPKFKYTNGLGNCGQVNWNVAIYDSLYPENTSSCYTVIKPMSINKILFSSRVLNGAATLNYNGKIVIEHYISATSNIGCPIMVVDTLTVSNAVELPTINDNIDHEVCLGSTVSFKTLPSQVKGFNQLKWVYSGAIQNNKDSIIQIKMDSAVYLYLQVANSSGCIAERNVNYSIRQHNAILNNDNTFCQGQMVNIVANTSNLPRPIYYKWSINGIDTSLTDSAFSLVINQSKKVRLRIQDGEKCEFADSVSNGLYLNANLTLKSNPMICRDSIATVRAIDINQSKNYTYKWKLNGKDSIINDSIFHFKMKKDSKVLLKILYQAGCSITDSIELKSIPTPEVNLLYVPFQCAGALIKLQPNIINRPDTINYLWTNNKAILSRDSQINLVFSITTLVKVKVSNRLGCSTEDTATVFIYPEGPATINHLGQYHPSSYILLTLTKPYVSYLWFNGSTAPSTAVWANTLGPAGDYKLWCKVTDKRGCTYSDTAMVNTNAYLNLEPIETSGLSLYPNPVVNELSIALKQDAHVELYTIDGKFLHEQNLTAGMNKLNLTDYSKGVYVVKVSINGWFYNRRIIKE